MPGTDLTILQASFAAIVNVADVIAAIVIVVGAAG